jgi:hypothetical protein
MPSPVTRAELKLAYEISSCPLVKLALGNNSHECSDVVNWQAEQWTPKVEKLEGSPMHRPEAWTGQLSAAPIMFVASNPSFDKGEHFPNWDSNSWSEDLIADFGANRFTNQYSRGYGATDIGAYDGPDRTIGLEGVISKRVSHWNWVRQFAAMVLGKDFSETSAITDYVMTEFVHCSSRYFERILELSPAKLIFIAGVKTGKSFAETYSDLVPDDWGSWSNSPKGKGKWPKSKGEYEAMLKNGEWTIEQQSKNSFEAKLGGKTRTFVYIARPGGGSGLNAPWVHEELVHPELLKAWKSKI